MKNRTIVIAIIAIVVLAFMAMLIKDGGQEPSGTVPEKILTNPNTVVLGDIFQLRLEQQSPLEAPFDAEEFIYLMSAECLTNNCWEANRRGSDLWPSYTRVGHILNFQDVIDVVIDTSEVGIIPAGTYYLLAQTFFGPPSNVARLDEMDVVSTTTPPLLIKHPASFSEGYPLTKEFGGQFGNYTLSGIRFFDDTIGPEEDILSVYFDGEAIVKGEMQFSDFLGSWSFYVADEELSKMPFNGESALRGTERRPIQNLTDPTGITGAGSEMFVVSKYSPKVFRVTAKIGDIRQIGIGAPKGGAGNPSTEIEILEILSE